MALAAKKKINHMKRAIQKDKDESVYGLGKFDEELKQLDEELTNQSFYLKAGLS